MDRKSPKVDKSLLGNTLKQNQKYNNNRSKTSTEPKPLLECISPGPLLLSKPLDNFPTQKSKRNSQRKSNFFRSNRRGKRAEGEEGEQEENDHSPIKNEPLQSINDLREPSDIHLIALRSAFDEVLSKSLVADSLVDQQYSVWLKLRQAITELRPGCQIFCYGSYLFKCCLNKKSYVDVDIQFREALSHDPLKEIHELVLKCDLVGEAAIESDRKPSCVNVIIKEPNMGIRITSGYLRGFHLSKIIQLYTKFDSRLLKLMRLFRYFAKICNIDQMDIGMLHPVTYHLMIIHFLQQLEPAVLPCLHEYAFGIDHVPSTLSDNQYGEFFRVCDQYSQTWKSTNSTPYEYLFLQFLSYYVKTFNTKQFVVSIQTRMPVVKTEKNWQSRRLLVEDPTDIKRSLCQTMLSTRSVDYFRDVFNSALNYFGREQKLKKKQYAESNVNDPNDDDLVEIVVEEEKSTNDSRNSLHNSYKLFYRKFPPSVAKDSGIKQNRIRDYYKNLFDEKTNPMPQALLKFNPSNDNFDQFVEEEIRQALQHDEEENFETMDDNDEMIDEEISSPTPEDVLDEQPEEAKEVSAPSPPPPPPSIVPQQIDLAFNFQPENFNAEQGAPITCPTCQGCGHFKQECPELILPTIKDLPKPTNEWLNILSNLCKLIAERSRPMESDIRTREEILSLLRTQFQKECPDCYLNAFGSFYNGFGFRQSDLDVCFIFKDGREQNNEEIIRILKRLLQSMRSSTLFDNVQPVLHAKVPIIRSRHRKSNIDIDISLHNTLAIENTRLLKCYTDIDPRVSELGYIVKHFAKFCDIADASRGTISSYAYIIMVIHFLQHVEPPVLPVLQQMTDENESSTHKKCGQWNIYFFDKLDKLKTIWKQQNDLSTGALWLEFLRYYTEKFDYDEHIVTIRMSEPLLRRDKGWFRKTIAIEDPFELTHNLTGGLRMKNWTMIRRALINAREKFGVPLKDFDMNQPDMQQIEKILFDIDVLCPQNAPKRCPWCQGPYHIRKRCPKFASLAEQNQSKGKQQYYHRQRSTNEQHYSFDYQENYHQQYSFPGTNGHYLTSAHHQYPYSPYFNGQPQPFVIQTFSNGSRHFQPTSTQHQSYSTRECFFCHQPGHIKAQCPQFRQKHK